MKIRVHGATLEGEPKELFNYFMLTQGYDKLINTLQALSEVEFPVKDLNSPESPESSEKPKDES